MIMVDSSVWIDYFNGIETPETNLLDKSLGFTPIAIGDLILTEVLQGFRSDSDYRKAKGLLLALDFFEIAGQTIALKSAENYRVLRQKGITIRKTIDTIIATYCLEMGIPLLFSDKDFSPFVDHLGLISAAT